MKDAIHTTLADMAGFLREEKVPFARKTNIKVDLAVGLTGFEKQLVSRATEVDLGGVVLPVATAEDLILLKLIASRPRDTEDVQRIVARQGDDLDWNYLLATGRELQEAVSQDLVSHLEKLRLGLKSWDD